MPLKRYAKIRLDLKEIWAHLFLMFQPPTEADLLTRISVIVLGIRVHTNIKVWQSPNVISQPTLIFHILCH